MTKPVDGKGHVFLIDSCLEDNAQCYLIPTDIFIKDVCAFFDIKTVTFESAIHQMSDADSKSNSSKKFMKLFENWTSITYDNMPCVLNADATICMSFTDWEQMYDGGESLDVDIDT